MKMNHNIAKSCSFRHSNYGTYLLEFPSLVRVRFLPPTGFPSIFLVTKNNVWVPLVVLRNFTRIRGTKKLSLVLCFLAPFIQTLYL